MKRSRICVLIFAVVLAGCKDRSANPAPAARPVTTPAETPPIEPTSAPADELALHRDRLRSLFSLMAERLDATGLGGPLLVATEAIDREGVLRVTRCFQQLDAQGAGWESRFRAGTPSSFVELRMFRDLDEALQRVQHRELAQSLVSLCGRSSISLSSEAIRAAADTASVDPAVLRAAMGLPPGFELESVLGGLRLFSAKSTISSLKRLGVHGELIAALVRQDQTTVERLWEAYFRERLRGWASQHGVPAGHVEAMRSAEEWLLAWRNMPVAARNSLWSAVEPGGAFVDSDSLPAEIRVRVILLAHGYQLERVRISNESRNKAAELLSSPSMLLTAYQIATDASLPLSAEQISQLRAGRGGDIPRATLAEALFEFGRTLGFDESARLLGIASGDGLRQFAQSPPWDTERSRSQSQDPTESIAALRKRLARMRAQVQQDLQSYSETGQNSTASPVRLREPNP